MSFKTFFASAAAVTSILSVNATQADTPATRFQPFPLNEAVLNPHEFSKQCAAENTFLLTYLSQNTLGANANIGEQVEILQDVEALTNGIESTRMRVNLGTEMALATKRPSVSAEAIYDSIQTTALRYASDVDHVETRIDAIIEHITECEKGLLTIQNNIGATSTAQNDTRPAP